MSSKNLYNQWQRFCAASNVPKDEVKRLYDTHKSEIRTSNPTLWFNYLNKSTFKEREEDDQDITESTPDILKNDNNMQLNINKDAHEQVIKDVYDTLTEIKSFLIFLISEPSRHVKSFIELEEKTDVNILKRWTDGMTMIMNKLKHSEEYSNNNFIIDLKQIYSLLYEHIFSVPKIEKIGQVSFINVTHESDLKIKLLFESKRKRFSNEFIIPIIIKNAVVFFYNSKELLNLIDNRYRSEILYNNDYITTSPNKSVEFDFFITHMIYSVLHAMLHLYCSVIFNNSYMNHEDHNYYKTVEGTVPRPLFKYFLTPSI